MPIHNHVTIDYTIQFLNKLLELDRDAVEALINARVPTNKEMADHPTVQVNLSSGTYLVGMLGILNGLFGIDNTGFGPIVGVFDDGKLIAFRRLGNWVVRDS